MSNATKVKEPTCENADTIDGLIASLLKLKAAHGGSTQVYLQIPGSTFKGAVVGSSQIANAMYCYITDVHHVKNIPGTPFENANSLTTADNGYPKGDIVGKGVVLCYN